MTHKEIAISNPSNLLSEIEKATKVFQHVNSLIKSHNQEALSDIDLKDFDKLNHEYELYIQELSLRAPAQTLRNTCQKERNKRLREKAKSLSKSNLFTGEDIISGDIASASVFIIYKNRPVRHIGWVIDDPKILNQKIGKIYEALYFDFFEKFLKTHPKAVEISISPEDVDTINEQMAKSHPVIIDLISRCDNVHVRRCGISADVLNGEFFWKYRAPTFVEFKSGYFIDAGFDNSVLSQYGIKWIPAVIMDDNNKLLSGPNIHRLSKVANIG